jgi:uncharacterized membrane protein (DUF2068 family)
MTSRSRRRSVVILIAIFKLLKGALLMTVGVGLSRFSDAGLSGTLMEWLRAVHIDPDGRHFGRAIHAIAALDGRRLAAVRAGMVVYAALFLTEGGGLLAGRRWAESFTIVVTGSFVPLEVFEVVRRPDGLRLAVLLANIAVVWYLLSFRRAAAQATARARS